MCASVSGVSSMPTCQACYTWHAYYKYHAWRALLCVLNYSQTCDSYNIRIFFAIDRCLLCKSKFIFILSEFLLNSEIIFNIRSIFICATAALTETFETFSRAELCWAPYKTNENIVKVKEKIITKNWWNLCKNMPYLKTVYIKIHWLQYIPFPMVECNLNPWLEFLAACLKIR